MNAAPRSRRLAIPLALASLFGAALVTVSPVATPPAMAAGYSKPSGVKAAKVSANSIALTWKKVKNAPAYRVSFSTKKNMKGAKTIDVVGNYLEWTRVDPDKVYASPRLSPSKTYYFRVKVLSLTKASLSSYSKVIKVKTASATSYPELAPVALKATARSTTSMHVSWSSRGPGVRYKIIYGTDPALPYSKSKVTTSDYSETALTGLSSGTTYYYKVKVITPGGREISAFSKVAKFRPPTIPVSPPITVATYNICSYYCGSWDTRLPAIIDNLKVQDPDIVALEEISTTPLRGLLSSWSETLSTAGNSDRDYQTTDTPTRSVSGSTRLVYDANRFELGEHGSQALTSVPNDTKYAVWAILKDSASGKSMFAVATHLTVDKTGVSYASIRKTQAEEIVSLVSAHNTDDLPVVIAGDFNSGKAYKPSNVIYGVLTAAGYKDPLGNTDNSWAIAPTATAEHRVDLEYNTFNGFVPQAKVAKYSNGYDVDYIWHSSSVRVAVSRKVMKLDAQGKFVGVIPSDHNMLVAIIHLK